MQKNLSECNIEGRKTKQSTENGRKKQEKKNPKQKNKRKKKYIKTRKVFPNSRTTQSEEKFICFRLQKGPWSKNDDNRISGFLGRPKRWTQKLKSASKKKFEIVSEITDPQNKNRISSFISNNKEKKRMWNCMCVYFGWIWCKMSKM